VRIQNSIPAYLESAEKIKAQNKKNLSRSTFWTGFLASSVQGQVQRVFKSVFQKMGGYTVCQSLPKKAKTPSESLLKGFFVPRAGVEPARLAALVFETNASTNSAIWAFGKSGLTPDLAPSLA
jgi:hypothetical protein